MITIIAFAVFVNAEYRQTQKNNQLLVHTGKVQQQSEKVLSILKDIETGTRGYLITGDSVYLDPAQKGEGTINGSIKLLQKLISDNPVQVLRVNKLSDIAERRIAMCKHLQSIRSNPNYNVAAILPVLLAGKVKMDSMRSIDQQIQAGESRLMLIREKQNDAKTNNTEISLVVLSGSMLVLLIIAALAVKYLNRTRKNNLQVFTKLNNNMLFFNKRIDDILKGISDPFFALDKNYQFIFITEAVTNTLANGKGNIIGKNIFEVFPQYKHMEIMDKMQEVMLSGSTQCFEHREEFLDRWFNITVYPTSEGISVHLTDITEKKKYEKRAADYQRIIGRNQQCGACGWLGSRSVSWTSVTALIH